MSAHGGGGVESGVDVSAKYGDGNVVIFLLDNTSGGVVVSVTRKA